MEVHDSLEPHWLSVYRVRIDFKLTIIHSNLLDNSGMKYAVYGRYNQNSSNTEGQTWMSAAYIEYSSRLTGTPLTVMPGWCCGNCLIYSRSDHEVYKLCWWHVVMTLHSNKGPHRDDSAQHEGGCMKYFWTSRLRSQFDLGRNDFANTTAPPRRWAQWPIEVFAYESLCTLRCTTTSWNTNTLNTNKFSLLLTH